jgi:hypothetical protein
MADVAKQKLRFDLISPFSLAEVAKSMTVGSTKHGATRYLDQPRADEEECQMASLLRHLNEDRCGRQEDHDGFKALAAVAARAMMILELRRRRE